MSIQNMTKDEAQAVDNSNPAMQQNLVGTKLREALNIGVGYKPGTKWYVDSADGNDTVNDGQSWENAFKTIQQAVDSVSSRDSIFCRGSFSESVSTPTYGSGGASYVNIIGVTDIGNPFGCGWSSGAAASPCLIRRGVGWNVIGFKFSMSATGEGIRDLCIYNDALAYDGTTGNIAIRGKVINCQFYGGANCGHGIRFYGVGYENEISDCYFSFIYNAGGTARAVLANDSSFAAAYRLIMKNNTFLECDGFIDMSTAGSSASVYTGNIFQGTGKSKTGNPKLNLGAAGGTVGNIVCQNMMGGTYSIAGGYRAAGAGDLWHGNYAAVAGGVTAANPA